MGLDMYLDKHVYIGANYEHRGITGKITIKEGKKPIPVNFDKVSYIVERAGYWRKANAVHKWFVDNVQDGNDDCRSYYVDTDKLQELLDICNEILEKVKLVPGTVHNGTIYKAGSEPEEVMEEGLVCDKPEVCAELLPTEGGFFFGGTNYDQYYYEDIQHTKEIMEYCLSDPSGEYYYQSSW